MISMSMCNLIDLLARAICYTFETVAMDFITKLPLSGGYDTILMITDTDCSKASIFIPCNETIVLRPIEP